MLGLALLTLACSRPSPPPSILVVVLDTVRADALGAYGNPRPLSPQFDAVAQAGVLFTDATAPSAWTWPSHASLFTGEPPWVNGAHSAWPGEGMSLAKGWLQVTPMREDLPTLAGRLSEVGYATHAYVANRLLAPELGITRGFEGVAFTDSDEQVTRGALARLAGDEARPQLLFVNYLGAHSPYAVTGAAWSRPYAQQLTPEAAPEWVRPYVTTPPGVSFFEDKEASENGLERYARGDLVIPPDGLAMLRDLYEGEVLGVDMQLNALLKAWTARYPDGVVIVTSDHGDLMGEHGLLGHSSYVYSRLTHVPLVVVAPGRLGAGQRCEVPVQLQDLYGLVLALAGVEQAPWTLLDAIGGTPRPEPILAGEWPRQRYAEEVGGRLGEAWRLMRDGAVAVVSGSGGSLELYDLAADPFMDHDLASERPDQAAALAAEAARLIPLGTGGQGIELSAEQAEALRALGYVDP